MTKKKNRKKEVYYSANPRNIKKFISKTLVANGYTLSPILVMMGAGDIVNLTPLLLK